MEQTESLNEVAERDGQPEVTNESGPETGEGGTSVSLPIPSVSKQQALVLAGIALVLVALYLQRRGGSSGSTSTAAKQAVRDSANSDREVEVAEDGEAAIVLPENPDEVTEYDAAIIGSDVFSVVGGGGD